MSSIRELDAYPVSYELAAQATPGDTSTTVISSPTVPFDGVISKVEIVPRAAITFNATNFAVYTLQNKGALGSGTTPVASRSWVATSSVAGTKEAMTMNATPANREVKAGDQLALARTIGGTGLATPNLAVIVTIVPR